MHRPISLATLTLVAVFTVGPAAAQPVPRHPVAPKQPDDYPFDPPEFRILHEATYYSETMQKLKKQGLYIEAEPYARAALRKMSVLPGQDMAVAVCRMNLADVCLKLGMLEEAEQHYRLCLRKFTGPRPPPLGVLGDNEPAALCLFRLADVCRDTGRFQEGELLCDRGLALVEAKRGKTDPQIAVGLTSLGQIYRRCGRLQQAEKHFQTSLGIREHKLGKDHVDTAASLSDLGELYMFMRDFRKAEPLLFHCLRIRETNLGSNHPDVATAMNNLGELCQFTGLYDKAALLNKGALQIREATLGPNHPDVATSLENLATAYQAMRIPCEHLLQRSRKIRESLK